MAENKKALRFGTQSYQDFKATFRKSDSMGELLDHDIQEKARVAFMPYFPHSIKTPAHREGIGFRKSEVNKCADIGWRYTQGGFAMQLKENMNEVIVEAEDAQKRLKEILNKLTSTAKNDLSSIKAVGKNIRQEMERINQSMNRAMEVMTNTTMIEAIANAEKLAAALESIDKLSTTRVSFAIIDTPPSSQSGE